MTAHTHSPTPSARSSAPGRSLIARLVRAELILMVRDPVALTFVLAFPIVSMLIIGGSFGRAPDDSFGAVDPAHWYVASYFAVVIGATGLVMMPVHIASYRERGVLRRFAAAGFPRSSFAIAQIIMGLMAIAVSGSLLLAVAAPVYGIPAPEQWWRAAAGVGVGSLAFVGIGVLLGTTLRTARSAQATGLLLFFPSFLLGVGGPPPAVMGGALQRLSEVLPLGFITNSIRDPWLGIAGGTGSLLAAVALAVVALGVAARRAAL
jgi:ABC-2 type transport system permease protein